MNKMTARPSYPRTGAVSVTAEAAPEDVEHRVRQRLASLTQAGGLVGVIVVVALYFQLKNSAFLTFNNVIEILRSGVLYFVVAAASTLVMVGGGLDLSVGALYAAGGVFAGEFMVAGIPWPIAILFALAASAAIGFASALITIYLRVPPLIATLGVFFVVQGFVTVLTGGNDIFTGIPQSFDSIGQSKLWGIPYLLFFGVAIGVACHVLLEKTSFGYSVKATGGNRSAARANGIRVNRIDMILYSMSAAAAAFAGILFAARTGAASPQAGGYGLTFEVLTAIIIGGTSLFGGIGTVFGSALGCLLFAEMDNGLAVINVNPLYQQIIVGAILVAAVAIDQARRRRQFRLR
jgi:ribose transport system permease protein